MEIQKKTQIRGKLIVVTGVDGSGKTTVIENLKMLNIPNLMILKSPLEPYRDVRKFTAGMEDKPLERFAFFLETTKNDVECLNRLLSEGKNVVIERYTETTIAFHKAMCAVHGIDPDNIIIDKSTILQPDLTLFLNAPLNSLMERYETRQNLDWWETREFQEVYQRELIEACREKNTKLINTEKHDIKQTMALVLKHMQATIKQEMRRNL